MYVFMREEKHNTLAEPPPWEIDIIRKNSVIDTYASIGYMRGKGMWATLRVRRMVPKGDGCTEHHRRPSQSHGDGIITSAEREGLVGPEWIWALERQPRNAAEA